MKKEDMKNIKCPSCDEKWNIKDFHNLYVDSIGKNQNCIMCPNEECKRLIKY